jgi:hypothetical protein
MENTKALSVFTISDRRLVNWSKEMAQCFRGSGYDPDVAWKRYLAAYGVKTDDFLIEHYPQVYIKWTTMRRLLNR